MLRALLSALMFAVLSLKRLLCQRVHFRSEGEEGLMCWVPHTQSGPGIWQRLAWLCARPDSQIYSSGLNLVRKCIYWAYSRWFD